jgi:hypothetical protein
LEDDRGIRIQFPAVSKEFYFLQGIQTGSGAYIISYLVGVRGPFLEDKAPEA